MVVEDFRFRGLPADCLQFRFFTRSRSMKHCKFCHKELITRRQKEFCSTVCALRQAHKDGKVTGGRFESNGGKVTVNCTSCGKPYEIWRYQLKLKRHFCSNECYSKGQSIPRGAGVTLTCAWCGKEFQSIRSKVTQNERRRVRAKRSFPYCSPECQSKGLKHLYSADERSGYIDGRSLDGPYTEDWHDVRRAIKRRDSNMCQLCGSPYKTHVHHIDHNTKNNDPTNLITLCGSCNVKERWHREIYEPMIRKLMRKILGI